MIRPVTRLAAILAALLLLACGSTPPSSFYSLSAAVPEGSATTSRGVGVALRVGPFTFPDYLRRPNIVTRENGGRLGLAEFERWAGSLEDDFHRVLGSNLGQMLDTGRIAVYPADVRFKADYQIAGEVVAFDGAPGGKVLLDTRWVISDPETQKALDARQSIIVEPVTGNDYGALVDAQSKALARLSREIADHIGRLQTAAAK